MKTNEFMGIYIHIPFCIKKCNYCDFLSFQSDDSGKSLYVDSLINRIRYFGNLYSHKKISTVFFGGGTPSTLNPGLVEKIMSALKSSFDMTNCHEITIECNPGTVTLEKLNEYKRCGINRLSFGLQSANAHELSYIGRIHTYDDFLNSYEMAKDAGFTNINIDVMSALPYQTLSSYEDTLKKVIDLKPTHISSYSLILEEGTPMYNVDKSLLPDEDTEREMYYLTDRLLKENGYNRYEISNYALPGFECKHNLSYWVRLDYLGIGLRSASLISLPDCYEKTYLPKAIRFSETSELSVFCTDDYYSKTFPEYTELTFSEVMEEFMFLGLRKTDGIDIRIFKNTFGYDIYDVYGKVIHSLMSKGLLEISGNIIKLTTLGIDVSNQVLSEFLEPKLN